MSLNRSSLSARSLVELVSNCIKCVKWGGDVAHSELRFEACRILDKLSIEYLFYLEVGRKEKVYV